VIGRHADIRLPAGDRVAGADAAAGAGAAAPVPDAFPRPGTAGPGGAQRGPAHGGHIRAVATLVDAGADGIGIFVAGGIEERDTQRGQLLPVAVRAAAGAVLPRGADLLDGVVADDAAQHGVDGRAVIVVERFHPGRHVDLHLDIERLLATAVVGDFGFAVQENVHDGNVGSGPIGVFVPGNIVRQIPAEFDEPHGLPGAGERHAGAIGRAEILAGIFAAGARAAERHRLAGRHQRRGRSGFDQQTGGMRDNKVIQPADVLDGHIQIQGRLHIRREKFPRLGRVRMRTHMHMEGPLHRGGRRVDGDQHAARIGLIHRETVGHGIGGDGGVILLGGTEAFGELLPGQIMMEVRAGWIVQVLQQLIQFRLVPERQADGEIQPLRGRQAARHRRLRMGMPPVQQRLMQALGPNRAGGQQRPGGQQPNRSFKDHRPPARPDIHPLFLSPGPNRSLHSQKNPHQGVGCCFRHYNAALNPVIGHKDALGRPDATCHCAPNGKGWERGVHAASAWPSRTG